MNVRLVLFPLIIAIVSGCNMGKKPEQAPPPEAEMPAEEVTPMEAAVPEPVKLEPLVNEAHEKICPYSHAIRNNVAVDFEIVGA